MKAPARTNQPNRSQTGLTGESIACRYLEQHGYQILETRWRCTTGEIDIVARQGADLVFVEVRTRRDDTADTALESVGARKQERLIALAYAYLDAHGLSDKDPWRIDVAAVCLPYHHPPQVEIIGNAVGW